jgi:anti-sigma B factor antagonist
VLRKHIIDQVEQGQDRIVVDLAGVDFMDSSGLAVLISGLRRTNERQGALALVSPTPSVRRVLSITGLDKVFPIYDSVDQATASEDA